MFRRGKPDLFFFLSLASCLFLAGCSFAGVSYPTNQVPQSVEKISKEEYGLDVQAKVVGKTSGALFIVDAMIDSTGQVPKEIHEKMGKVMQVITRVALSTDLPIDFCTVAVRDKEQGNELVITRSIDDIRRANADALGI
jgi:hypothetical protein